VLAQDDVDQLVVCGHQFDVHLPAELAVDRRVDVCRFDGPTVGGARNTAAALSTSEFLVFLDDDDVLAPGAVARFRELVTDPEVAFASGGVEMQVSTDDRPRLSPPRLLQGLYRDMTANFLAGSFVISRWLFDEVGGYNTQLAFGENYDLGIRLATVIRDQQLRYDWTSDVVVRVSPSGARYRDERAAAAAFTLESYPELLAGFPQQRATLHAILGVYHWRQQDRRSARSHLRQAVRAWPGDPRHAGRLFLSTLPPLADRRWRP
jgi:glycosyltransferase involved in cell wall biosynthesis